MTFSIAMRNRGLRPPSVLYPSADGVRLLQHLSQSKVSYTKTTTTAKPPPQPVLWFPNNNADCGGSTKGGYLLLTKVLRMWSRLYRPSVVAFRRQQPRTTELRPRLHVNRCPGLMFVVQYQVIGMRNANFFTLKRCTIMISYVDCRERIYRDLQVRVIFNAPK